MDYHYVFDVFNVFLDQNPKKTSELTYHAHILIFRRFSFLSKNFNGRKRKLTKIENLNVLSENKLFQMIPRPKTH